MGGLLFWVLRPVLKLVLYAAAVYLVAFLPAFVYTHLRPGSEYTQRPLIFGMVVAWSSFLILGSLDLRFGRDRVGNRAWRRKHAPSGAHGTAAWGDGRGLLAPKAGVLKAPTPLRGRLLGRLGGRVLRYEGDGHLLTIAPTRAGKGVSAVIPNLLTHPGSVVVTDLKGENYAVTAARRCVDLGHDVHALDPFDVVAISTQGGLISFLASRPGAPAARRRGQGLSRPEGGFISTSRRP